MELQQFANLGCFICACKEFDVPRIPLNDDNITPVRTPFIRCRNCTMEFPIYDFRHGSTVFTGIESMEESDWKYEWDIRHNEDGSWREGTPPPPNQSVIYTESSIHYDGDQFNEEALQQGFVTPEIDHDKIGRGH